MTPYGSEFSNLCVFPPNKPLDATTTFSTVPVIYDQLNFVDFNSKGQWILGSSNITGTFWEGTLTLHENVNKLTSFEHSAHYISGSTSDGKFLNDTTIAFAEDTGMLTIVSLADGALEQSAYLPHIQRIPEIALWRNTPKVVTCSDRSLYLWDVLSVEISKNSYEYSHTAPINSIDVLQSDRDVAVSAANDRTALLWDFRTEKPSLLYRNEFSSLRSIRWNQKDDNYLIVGSQGGDVYLVDRRQPQDFVCFQPCFAASIHRMSVNGDGNQVAVCGDTKDIVVLDLNSNGLGVNRKPVAHKKHARDVKYSVNDLYSCGHDKLVCKL